MNNIYFSLILLVVISSGFAQTNPELQKMADADQSERMSGNINWVELNKKDSIRLAKATQLFNDGELETAQDYYNAGIIFQHGKDTIASKMAV